MDPFDIADASLAIWGRRAARAIAALILVSVLVFGLKPTTTFMTNMYTEHVHRQMDAALQPLGDRCEEERRTAATSPTTSVVPPLACMMTVAMTTTTTSTP